MHIPLIYHLTRHFVLARVICWRFFTRKFQSKHGNFLFFSCGGQKLFLLIINDLENIFKKVAQKLVYIIYLMYICSIIKTQRYENSNKNRIW